jgi:hypothetical protein
MKVVKIAATLQGRVRPLVFEVAASHSLREAHWRLVEAIE